MTSILNAFGKLSVLALGMAVFTGCASTSSLSSWLENRRIQRPPSLAFPSYVTHGSFIEVHALQATPVDKIERQTPFPNDYPPRRTLLIKEPGDSAVHEGRYYFPSQSALTVYRLPQNADSPWKTIARYREGLERLLKERPATASAYVNGRWNRESYVFLPDYPGHNSAHAIQAKLSYLDAEWGSGLFYLTQFTQDGGSAINNEELTYLFQGITKDGRNFVAGTFHVTHTKLAPGFQSPHEGGADKGDYSKDERRIEGFADDSFNPSLAEIRQWVAGIKVK